MRRSRLHTAVLASAVLVAGSLVLVAPAPGRPAVAVADTSAATGTAGLFVPLTGRLLDTRNGTGGYSTPMPANSVRTVPAASVAGIPATGVSALALTLTAVGATTTGAVSVAAGDVASPTGTALVFNPGDSVSNTDLVALHADGQLHVVSNAAVNLVIDVQGYFTAGDATTPGGFVPLNQARIVDTRIGSNVPQGRVATGGWITVTAAGLAGVPSDASGVYVNIAVLGQTTNGYLRTYAAGSAVPTTGALGFDDSSQTASVAVPLSGDGAFTVLVGAGGPVDLLIDIQGYFTATGSTGGFTPAAVHLLDTRAAPVRTLAGNSVMTLSVAGVAGIPAVGASLSAVTLNLRTVQAAAGPASGFIRVWPSDQPEPSISSLNYTSQNIYRTDVAIVAPAADGTISIRNGGPGAVDLVVDVEGWFADPGPAVPTAKSPSYPQDVTSAATGTDATFYLSEPDAEAGRPAAATFSYSVDGGAVTSVPADGASVTIPPAVSGLAGSHVLTVTALDSYGVASASYRYAWTVGTPDPPSPDPDVTPTSDSTAVEDAASTTATFIQTSDWTDQGLVTVDDSGQSFTITGKGAEPALVSSFVQSNGYAALATYRSTPYSLAELDAEEQRLLTTYPHFVTASLDPSLSQIRLAPDSSYYAQRTLQSMAADEQGVISAYPVSFDPASAPITASNRYIDTPPAYGGALLVQRYVNGYALCTAGVPVSISVAGKTRYGITTAGHCGGSRWVNAANNAVLGAIQSINFDHDTEVLLNPATDNYRAPYVWKDAWNSYATATLRGVGTAVGQRVCVEGAISGQWCGSAHVEKSNLNIYTKLDTGVTVGPGFVVSSDDYASAGVRRELTQGGDSGSPVVTFDSNGRYATVLGFLTGGISSTSNFRGIPWFAPGDYPSWRVFYVNAGASLAAVHATVVGVGGHP